MLQKLPSILFWTEYAFAQLALILVVWVAIMHRLNKRRMTKARDSTKARRPTRPTHISVGAAELSAGSGSHNPPRTRAEMEDLLQHVGWTFVLHMKKGDDIYGKLVSYGRMSRTIYLQVSTEPDPLMIDFDDVQTLVHMI